jgi:hypothetical protein
MQCKSTLAAAFAAFLTGCCAWAEADQTGVLVYQPEFFAEARPTTANDMIGRLPGFQFDEGNSARGFAGTAGNVLIDGQRPTSKSDDLDDILSRIPAGNVERIEVIRGGAPGIDMHGHTVVANVILKHADSTQYVVDLQDHIWPDGHTVPSARFEYTHRTGESVYEGSLSLIGNYDDSVGEGFYRVTNLATDSVQRWDARSTGRGAGWGLTGAATVSLLGGQFKANVSYSDSPFHSGLFYTSSSSDVTILDSSGSKSGELGLHWNRKFGSYELETLLLQRLGRGTYINTYDAPGYSALFGSKNNSGESIARATVRYNPDSSLTFETGLEGAYNFLDGSSNYSENGVDIPLPSANAQVDEKRGEVFGQATWKFATDWMAEAGARFEYSRIGETGYTTLSRTFFYPKPRFVLTWTPAKDMQIRLRYERVLGQLDFNNFVASANLGASGVDAGNPELEPDRHTQYEISFQYDFWSKGSFLVKFMHDEVSGVVDNIPVTGSSGVFDAPGNIGDGTNNQITVQLTLPLDRLGVTNGRLKFENTFDFTRVRDPETGELRGFSGQRPQNISVTFTQDVESLKSTWGLFFYNCWDEYYYRLAEVRHRRVIPAYLEFWWEYKPTPEWTFQLAVNNWGAFSYQDMRDLYAGPRAGLAPYEATELKIKSQPRLHLKIRKTFG